MANPIGRGSAARTLHTRIVSADEDSRSFRANLHESADFDYRKAKKSYRNLPVRFHGPSDDQLRRGKAVGELNADMDDSKKRISLRAAVADKDEWKKLSGGVYSHLKIEHDMDGDPVHVSLTDSKQSKTQKYLKLAKSDGSVSTVKIKAQGAVGSHPLMKKDISLDPFRVHRHKIV